ARADIADIGRAHREKAPVLAQRELDLGDEVAALIVAEERFRTRRRVFHRTAELARRPQRERELDEHTVAGAEIAADVAGQYPYVLRCDTEHGGHLALLPHRAAAAGIERVAAGRRIVVSERRARLERNAGDAVDVEIHRYDVVSAGECLVCRLAITEQRIDRNVVRNFIPD